VLLSRDLHAAPSQQSLLALSWLNFFLSGMQTAFGCNKSCTGRPRRPVGTARTEPALCNRRGRRSYRYNGLHRIFRVALGNVPSRRPRRACVRRAHSDSRRRDRLRACLWCRTRRCRRSRASQSHGSLEELPATNLCRRGGPVSARRCIYDATPGSFAAQLYALDPAGSWMDSCSPDQALWTDSRVGRVQHRRGKTF
jgi:hypothetical protein